MVGHERAVDLELRDGEAREVGERRVAGAEVVDGDADAELLEPARCVARPGAGSETIALSVISTVERRGRDAAT